MMNRISACAAIALAAGVASAGFTGVELRANSSWDNEATTTINDGTVYTVIRMYAVFDTQETVASVGQASAAANFRLIGSGSSFFQDTGDFGGNTAPASGLFGIAPTLEWDSFVGLGKLDATGGDTTTVDPDFGFVDTNLDTFEDRVNGGWFNVNPSNNQGESVFNSDTGLFETFLGQYTIRGLAGVNTGDVSSVVENSIFEGTLTIFESIVGGGITERPVTFVAGPIPAPGALAMFGIAGMGLVRRRR